MPNSIKYSTTAETEALKSGNYYIGVGDVGKGPSDVTGYWAGITPPSGGYTLYGNKALQGPSIYVASTDLELINLTKLISGQNITTVNSAIHWYFQQSDRVIVNRDYETITTNGLVVNLDAGFVASYPATGSVWLNVSPTSSATASLINSPTYTTGHLSFDDALSQYSTLPNIGSLSQWTVEVWFRLTNDLTSKVSSLVCNEFNGSNLNFSIGTNNAPTNYNLCVGFFNGTWRNTTGFTPTTNTWYQVVGTYDGATIRQYVDGVASGGTLTYSGTPTSGGDLRMMRRWDSPVSSSNLVDGDLAIVRIYNRALAASEVLSNYNAQSTRFVSSEFTNDFLSLDMNASNIISYSGGPTWLDVTDNGHVGSLNGVTFSSENGGYFIFDGVNDTISIPDSQWLSLSTSYYRTFQVWANLDTLPSSGQFMPIFGKLSNSYGFDGHYLAVNSNGTIRYVTNGGSIARTSTSSATVSTGNWYFFSCVSVISATVSSTRVYLNNTQIISATHGSDTYSESNTFYLGYIGSGVSSNYLDGKIGEFYAYGRDLSNSEINSNYLATKTRYGL